ncbi:hypothetical protein C0Q70_17994 [Pomacea canaliculata]|uniref:SRCR domain-containing protein n=1 Tax=Pomacea canaliculata TaxID=400727 RepID=A0A2T7NLZ5_POMCA|nr:hypothetical protein C0Q70_17994 [Pomacea canaliculata]
MHEQRDIMSHDTPVKEFSLPRTHRSSEKTRWPIFPMDFSDILLLSSPLPVLRFKSTWCHVCTALAVGPLCFSCSQVSAPEDCTTLVECGNDEVCFAERRISGDLQETYTLGCEKMMVCQLVGGLTSETLVGKKRMIRAPPTTARAKRDVTVCSKCCGESQCNRNVCVVTVAPPTQGLPASQEVYVRLVGGSNAYEGTVEIFYNGQWGSICDDDWSGADAAVVCRMLGYSPTGAGGVVGGTFPASSGRIWLDDVNCTGKENSLVQCDKSEWDIHDCNHKEDAGVLCSSVTPEDDVIFLLDTGLGGEIFRMNLMTQSYTTIPINRLYAPSSIDYDPEYGRIYLADPRLRQIVSVHFDGTDAREVRQLNMDAVLEKVEVDPLNRKLFYTDTGNNVIAVMNLDGTGYNIIVNSNLDEPHNRIYFVDGGTHRIEVMDLLGGDRREIFRDAGAHFYSIVVFDNYIYYTDWNRNTLMRLNKDGSGITPVGPPSFQELTDIRIQKYGYDLPGVTTAAPLYFDRDRVFVRLNGDHVATSGYVEVYANGQWGTVCDHDWDDNDAAVVCRMLGFSEHGAVATNESASGRGNGLIVLDNIHCQGTERHLVDCGITQDDWARHSCGHDSDAGVQCTVDDTMNNFLVFTDSYTGLLVRMDLNTYSFTGLQMAGAYNPVALAYNPLDRRLYFSQVMSNPGSQIFSIGLDAGQPTLLKQMPKVQLLWSVVDGLAVDGNIQRLFYTDSGLDVIGSMDLHGNDQQVVVSGQLGQPRAITLDPVNRASRARRRQTKCGLLYFCDAGTHVIESVDTNGGQRKVVYSDLGAHFFGLAVTANNIYYSDWNRVSIMRINKDGSGLTTAGPPSFTRINAIIASEGGN